MKTSSADKKTDRPVAVSQYVSSIGPIGGGVSRHADNPDYQRTTQHVKRIIDTMTDRTEAILQSLGLELVRMHAQIRPLRSYRELAETLSQIEIVPEVKANVTHANA